MALLALGSLAVLLDAGAKYSGGIWRATTLAGERAVVARDDSSPDRAGPYRFRLNATLPLDRARAFCQGDVLRGDSASRTGDGSFDINCTEGAAVKSVGDLRNVELLSWPGDARYDRAVRF